MHWASLVLFACVQVDGPPPHAEPLRGVVVDSAGKPLAGVDVWLVDRIVADGRAAVDWRSVVDGGSSGFSRRIAGHACAHANERRRRVRPRASRGGRASQEPMPVAIWAHAARRSRCDETIGVGDSRARPEPIRLVIEEPGHAGFRLLGPDGAPLAGARVVPIAFAQTAVPRELAEKVGSVAGDDGVCRSSGICTRRTALGSRRFGDAGTQIIRTLGSDTTQDNASFGSSLSVAYRAAWSPTPRAAGQRACGAGGNASRWI